MSAPKLAKPLAESDLASVLGGISDAKVKGSAIAARDYVIVRGSYLLGCRVSELCLLRWEDIEPLDEGDKVRTPRQGQQAPHHPRQQRHPEAVRVVGPRRA